MWSGKSNWGPIIRAQTHAIDQVRASLIEKHWQSLARNAVRQCQHWYILCDQAPTVIVVINKNGIHYSMQLRSNYPLTGGYRNQRLFLYASERIEAQNLINNMSSQHERSNTRRWDRCNYANEWEFVQRSPPSLKDAFTKSVFNFQTVNARECLNFIAWKRLQGSPYQNLRVHTVLELE